MTTASKITLSRVLMIPVYLVTMYLSGGESNVWMYVSLAIFIIASLTDFVDGYIARHYNQVTDFGKFIDPLADKLLTIAAMCMFCQWGVFPAWALMIVLTREFGVTGLRLIAVQKGTVIAAGENGMGQCNVGGWTDIVAVSAGRFHTVGMRSDGTIVVTGSDGYGQCDVE